MTAQSLVCGIHKKNNGNMVVFPTLLLGHAKKLCHLQRHLSIYKQLKFVLN